jgi:hypothetical protein
MRARDNPFATAHIHRVRYQFDGLTWDQFLERLAQRNYRGAVVGPEGAGKSTLLEDLRSRLAARGFEPVPLRLTQEAPRFPRALLRHLGATLARRHVVLLDGAEQMSRWDWGIFRWRIRRAGGLVITAHRPGLLPTVLTCATSPGLLSEIVRRLLGETGSVSHEEIERLFRRHRGNVREALRELYDTCGSQPAEALQGGRRIPARHQPGERAPESLQQL